VLLATCVLAHGRDVGWITVFVLAIALVHFAVAFTIQDHRRLYSTLYVLAHVCLLDAAVRELYTWAMHNIQPIARESFISESVSVLLALYALAMITSGIARRFYVDRVIGLVVIGFVVAKLYLYDVWLLTRFYRITAFVALGIVLLTASYAYSRFRDKLDLLLK
jgi:uncharacterized membrane protein